MRDKGGRRRFRPGWMQGDTEGGVDNPALNLEPVASFSLGSPEDADADADADADPSVAITVTDYDKQDTSLV